MTAPWQPGTVWPGPLVEETPTQPVVIVSSRDGAEVPVVAGAVRLAKVATAAGWTVHQTFALADVPATSRRAAHQLASVAIRLVRGYTRGWATWHSIDGGPWRFSAAVLGLECLGIREFTARVGAS